MKALVKQIGIQFGVTFLALALLLTLGAPLLQSLPGQVSQPLQETVIRLGFAGTAEAITPDTTFTGSGDDLKIQAAVDALPATGGRIIIGPGNITFTTTVSRAINNITIEGSGKATYFANNGATALFSAGAQTGWVFKDFRTDAGWLTLASDTRLLGVLWRGAELVSNVVASGTTMPASPVSGQQFLQDTTGRKVLYSYNGSAWRVESALSNMTIYVDKTDGTDDFNHGTGLDAAAYKTVQFAWDSIPASSPMTATVYLNNETYTETLTLPYKAASVTFVGTLTAHDSLTATGAGQKGATTTLPTFVANVPLVDHHYNDQILRFTSGANADLYRIIDHNDTTTIRLASSTLTAAPQAGDTATVYDWGTTMSGVVTTQSSLSNISFQYIYFSNQFHATYYGSAILTTCKMASSFVDMYAKLWAFGCLTTGNNAVYLSEYATVNGGKSTAPGGVAFTGGAGAFIFISGGYVIDTAAYGMYIDGASVASTVPTDVYNFIQNCSSFGIKALNGSTATGTANNQYAANGTNEQGDAPSYAYVD